MLVNKTAYMCVCNIMDVLCAYDQVSGRAQKRVCLFGWFLNVPVNYKVILRTGPKPERLAILRAATHEAELGDHDFCLSQSHYTDTDPTSRERESNPGPPHQECVL